MTNWYLKTL